MNEQWKPIPGCEGRYEVSDQGRVKSLPFMQRYLLRNGVEAYRRTKEKVLSTRLINSGYIIVALYLDDVRATKTVHRLVAFAFCPGYAPGLDVNHKDGVKTNNAATNLEWLSRAKNHRHAVDLGLLPHATPVVDPATGVRYPSIARAAKEAKRAHRTVRKTFARPT